MSEGMSNCALCGDPIVAAETVVSVEIRSNPGRWTSAGEPETWPLCETHWAWWEESVRGALEGHRDGPWQLGAPSRPASWRLHPGLCDTCASRHGNIAWSMEVLPHTDYSYIPGIRPQGPPRKLRLCQQCVSWWRLHVRAGVPPEVRPARALEGDLGSWLQQSSADCAAFGLQERDMVVLTTTTGATGRACIETASPVESVRDGHHSVLFVGASASWLRQAARQLQPVEWRRVVVVARPDAADAARQAMSRGAGDLLTSPLSPQQIAGAFHRILARPLLARDKTIGLPILPVAARPDWGQPGHVFDIYIPAGTSAIGTALHLRRFLRGYDDVGSDGAGGLRLHVYCPDAAVERVLERLRTLVVSPSLVTYRGSSGRESAAGQPLVA